jgi:hypothetical protein
MSIRHLAAAALMTCVCAAHADVIPVSGAPSGQSAFLSGWTTASGTSVIGSGVLSNVNLIGGIAYGATGDQGASLADVLYGKASSSLGSAASATQLYYSNGIEGQYLLGKGHGMLAAMLGNGVSVIGSNGGVLVSQGSTGAQTAPVPVGGGTASAGGNAGGSVGGSGGGSTGSSGGGSVDSSAGGSVGGGTGIAGGGNGNINSGGTGAIVDTSGSVAGGGGGQVSVVLPPIAAAVLPTIPSAPAAGDVPEPSTIALMLAGVLGAGAIKRRRSR